MIKYIIYSMYNVNIYIINLDLTLSEVKKGIKNIPKYMYSNIKTIYIHNSEGLQSKNLDSLHNDNGIIEINSNSVKNIQDLLKLLIHELYHSIEHDIKIKYSSLFYSVCNEYKTNKNQILDKINSDPRLVKPKPEYYNILDYNAEFDEYLINTITYPVLYTRMTDLFATPYAITSISEYIAIGFEIFLFENKEWVSIYNPQLYNLINSIMQ